MFCSGWDLDDEELNWALQNADMNDFLPLRGVAWFCRWAGPLAFHLNLLYSTERSEMQGEMSEGSCLGYSERRE
jgi:hypothetical protein